MIKLDFKKPILDIKGEEQEMKLSELLAGLLMGSKAKAPLDTQYFVWGLELAKSGVIEVDEAGLENLKKFLDDMETPITVLGKGRLNEVIKEATKKLDKVKNAAS